MMKQVWGSCSPVGLKAQSFATLIDRIFFGIWVLGSWNCMCAYVKFLVCRCTELPMSISSKPNNRTDCTSGQAWSYELRFPGEVWPRRQAKWYRCAPAPVVCHLVCLSVSHSLSFSLNLFMFSLSFSLLSLSISLSLSRSLSLSLALCLCDPYMLLLFGNLYISVSHSLSRSLLSRSLSRSLSGAWPSIIIVIEGSMSSGVLARLDECRHAVAQTETFLHVLG